MNHLEVYEIESAALEPTEWERWIAKVEKLLGHSADGDQATDGYSMDGFYEKWKRGETPDQAVRKVCANCGGSSTDPDWHEQAYQHPFVEQTPRH